MYVWEDKGLNEFIWKQGAFPGFMSLNGKAVSQNPCSVFWKCTFLNPWGLPPCRRRWGVGYTTEPLLRRIHSIIRSLSAMFFLLKAAKLWAWWILNGGKKRERKRKTNDCWRCGCVEKSHCYWILSQCFHLFSFLSLLPAQVFIGNVRLFCSIGL